MSVVLSLCATAALAADASCKQTATDKKLAGAASGGGAIKLYKDWEGELAKKRADCATARAAFIAAKDKLMKDCPTECWPRPFADINCP